MPVVEQSTVAWNDIKQPPGLGIMNAPLRTLGTPPNAWSVNAGIADITRPPLEPKPITLRSTPKLCG
jgi:hypothetical protein